MRGNTRPPSPSSWTQWRGWADAVTAYLARLGDDFRPMIPLLGRKPAKGMEGQIAYNPTTQRPCFFNGTDWIDL